MNLNLDGQTGSGKTYTMGTAVTTSKLEEEGVIPRAIRYMYSIALENQTNKISNIKFSVSFAEIYNDEIRDLLHPDVQPTVS